MALSEIRSSLKTFAWSFSVCFYPIELSVVATDENKARSELFKLIGRITKASFNYKLLASLVGPSTGPDDEIFRQRESIRKSINANFHVSEYALDPMDFDLDYVTDQGVLRELLLRPPNRVKPFHHAMPRIACTIISKFDGESWD